MVLVKGQLISKGNFSVFNSPKKTNLKTKSFILDYWGRNFLFVFWENWKKQKCPYEINWPLLTYLIVVLVDIGSCTGIAFLLFDY